MAQLKEIKAFQTSDGKVHSDKGEAIKSEFTIEIQQILNNYSRATSYTAGNLAEIILRNSDTFLSKMQKMRAALNRIQQSNKL